MPPGFEPGAGSVAQIDVMEAASFGWNRVMKDPVTIIAGCFIAGLLMQLVSMMAGTGSYIFQIFGHDLSRTDPAIFFSVVYGIQIIGGLLNSLVAAFFHGGFVRFLLNIASGKPYAIGDIFSETKLWTRMFVASFLSSLLFILGMMFCFAPFVFFAIVLSLTNFLIVDKDMGALDAMQESFKRTEGHRLEIFLYGLLSVGMIFLGYLACCVGLFVASPVIGVGFAFLYLRITRQPTASPV